MTNPNTPMTNELVAHLEASKHLQALMDSFCVEPNCYEPRFDDGLCEEHSTCSNCGDLARFCMGNCADEEGDWPDDWPDEDPLAGDVEATGGYPEPEVHPVDAHDLRVAAQHGHYTGW